MQTILLTGGTGFLGSKIVEIILANGCQVIMLVRKNSSFEHLGVLIDNPKLIKVVLEEQKIEKVFSTYKIDAIIHTATCYGRNNESWAEIAEVNLILPLRLLSAGERAHVKCFINTDTFFNEKIKFEKNENYYVQTKKEFLDIAKNVSKSLSIKFINLRIEQMYGPNDSSKKFIPFIINQLLSSTKQIPLTLGEQKRDFVFVDDVANAFLNALKNQSNIKHYEEFGLGSGDSVPIRKVVEYIKKITKSNSTLCFGNLAYRENEIMDSFADISNNKKINWQAVIPWKKGLQKTVEFYYKIK